MTLTYEPETEGARRIFVVHFSPSPGRNSRYFQKKKPNLRSLPKDQGVSKMVGGCVFLQSQELEAGSRS